MNDIKIEKHIPIPRPGGGKDSMAELMRQLVPGDSIAPLTAQNVATARGIASRSRMSVAVRADGNAFRLWCVSKRGE